MWLGDWVAVASGLGVRVTSDGRQAVTVTVDAEQRGGTRGLCGPYNDDPAGKHHLTGDTLLFPCWGCGGDMVRGRLCRGHVPCPPTCPSPPCAPR